MGTGEEVEQEEEQDSLHTLSPFRARS